MGKDGPVLLGHITLTYESRTTQHTAITYLHLLERQAVTWLQSQCPFARSQIATQFLPVVEGQHIDCHATGLNGRL
jgi:hypothetical protein